jgi:hypothetical protein
MSENVHGEGEFRDIMRSSWFGVSAVGPNGAACSFGLPRQADRDQAKETMERLILKHPEYSEWAVIQFTPFIHVTEIRFT